HRLTRVSIPTRVLDDMREKKSAVIGASHFLAREAFMRSGVLDRDCSLSGDSANQFEVIRLEGSKWIQPICVDGAVDPGLAHERRADGRTDSLRHNGIDSR